MKYSILITLLLISSCGSSYKRPESIEQKMERFQARDTNTNKVPEFVLLDTPPSRSRMPASVQDKEDSIIDEAHMEKKISRKKLYFLTLLEQYNHFRSFEPAQSFKEISICPSFHEEILKTKEDLPLVSRKIDFNTYKNIHQFDKQTLAHYPELMLPVSSSGEKVYEELSKDNGQKEHPLEKALFFHTQKLFSELAELCEHGMSDNYYTFANFETHLKAGDFAHNRHNLTSLAKTTVVSNLLLLKSIEQNSVEQKGRFPASQSIEQDTMRYQNKTVSHLGIKWVDDYSEQVIKQKP